MLAAACATAPAADRVPGLGPPSPAPPAIGPVTRYDAASKRLELPGVRVSAGQAAPACYDAVFDVDTLTPLRLRLEAFAPRACDAAGSAPSHFDLRDDMLRLPGLRVDGSGDVTCHDAALRRVGDEPLTLELVAAQPAPCAASAAPTAASGALPGSVVLGSPSERSIRATVVADAPAGRLWIEYGLAPDTFNHRGAPVAFIPGEPATLAVDGLLANQRYHYRLLFQAEGSATVLASTASGFHTARPAGSPFTFTLQADSHLDENADLATYHRTLANVRADDPDFHVDLGDTSMVEKHALPLSASSPPAASAAEVERRFAYEHAQAGRAAHGSPLFVVNGNHDGELGWLRNGSDQNLAVWAAAARKRYFANPEPDAFYGGDAQREPFVGLRAAWYAWHWGDALFVVLDPYWNSSRVSGGDAWALTLGERQYRWLADTLAASPARFKFVFLHSLVGGLDGQMRGGIEGVPFFEWGGRNADGSPGFAQRRPGWELPIHDLLRRHGVTAVFKGHDHFYARQELDGIVYQTVPQPSARNFSSGANLARDYRYLLGQFLSSSGHLRVTVGPQAATVEYVRAWLPSQETAERRNGQVVDRWTVQAAGATR